jgi:hypothetical protein
LPTEREILTKRDTAKPPIHTTTSKKKNKTGYPKGAMVPKQKDKKTPNKKNSSKTKRNI